MNDTFAAKANQWDTPQRKALADKFAAELNYLHPDCNGMALLELGCGTGLVGLRYAPEANALYMVDTSPAMLEVLRMKDEAQGQNVHIHEAALTDLAGTEIPKESIDWVFSNMALHHIEDIPALIATLHGLLKPGGHVTIGDLVTEPGTFHAPEVVPHNGFDPEALAALFEAGGFTVNSAQTYLTMPREDKDGVTRTYSAFVLDATRITSAA